MDVNGCFHGGLNGGLNIQWLKSKKAAPCSKKSMVIVAQLLGVEIST